MKTFVERFCERYKQTEEALRSLLPHMTEVAVSRGGLLVEMGSRNPYFYLLKSGLLRGYLTRDGNESTVWFICPGEAAFSSWGYVAGAPAQISIEALLDSVVYRISRSDFERLFSSSLHFANMGRRFFEREILSYDQWNVLYNVSTAKERYLTLMKNEPDLLQHVPLKHLASYLNITPQSLSRIRANLSKSRTLTHR